MGAKTKRWRWGVFCGHAEYVWFGGSLAFVWYFSQTETFWLDFFPLDFIIHFFLSQPSYIYLRLCQLLAMPDQTIPFHMRSYWILLRLCTLNNLSFFEVYAQVGCRYVTHNRRKLNIRVSLYRGTLVGTLRMLFSFSHATYEKRAEFFFEFYLFSFCCILIVHMYLRIRILTPFS